MKKNYWPLGILLIILLGICLLIGLVYVSLLQPNINDNSYMQNFSNVDKNTELFLGKTKSFAESYDVAVEVNGKKDYFIAPYLLKAKKIEEKTHQQLFVKTGEKNRIVLDFIPKQKNTIKILGYSAYAMRYYDREYRDKADLLFEGDVNKKVFDFSPKDIGRWKIVLKIDILQDGEEKQAYLQRDFVAQN